jgi:hypothetical protein
MQQRRQGQAKRPASVSVKTRSEQLTFRISQFIPDGVIGIFH